LKISVAFGIVKIRSYIDDLKLGIDGTEIEFIGSNIMQIG
jgi:hypothetical protein